MIIKHGRHIFGEMHEVRNFFLGYAVRMLIDFDLMVCRKLVSWIFFLSELTLRF